MAILLRLLNGLPCEPGWGYNNDEVLPRCFFVEGQEPTVREYNPTTRHYVKLYRKNQIINTHLSHLNFPSTRQLFDLFLTSKNDKFYYLRWQIVQTVKECENQPSHYPKYCSHYVKKVEYGHDIVALIPSKHLPLFLFKFENSLRSREITQFTESQLNTNCQVLINFKEKREMLLSHLLIQINNLEQEQEIKIPLRAHCETIHTVTKQTVINAKNLHDFVIYLAFVYRKIEFILQNYNRHVEPDPEIREFQIHETQVVVELSDAEKQYKEMNRSDFEDMYPILKALYFRYVQYLQHHANHRLPITESSLPGSVKELKSWLKILNTWKPINTQSNEDIIASSEPPCNRDSAHNDFLQQLHDPVGTSVSPTPDSSANSIDPQSEKTLKLIMQQLQKIQKRNPNPIIDETIEFLQSPQRDNEKIRSALFQLIFKEELELDEDTKDLINQYCL